MQLISWIACFYIAITFAAAAVGKTRTGELAGTLRVMGLPERTVQPLSRLLVAIEAMVAIAICFSATWPIVAPLTVCLVLFFMVIGITFRSRGVPCACFGSLTRDRLGWSTVWRNIPLLLAALLVWLNNSAPAEGMAYIAMSFLTAAGLCLMQPLGRYLIGRA